MSATIEKLAAWLYARDAQWLVRVSWAEETDGLKDVYRAEARAALDAIKPTEDERLVSLLAGEAMND